MSPTDSPQRRAKALRSDAALDRLVELTDNVLAPLVLGGPLHPVRPVGVRLALTMGLGDSSGYLGTELGVRGLSESDVFSRIEVARVRVARLIAPVDTLPDLTSADWALVAALNDLLQLTNHELAGFFNRSRYARLLASVRDLCELIPAPVDVGMALSRHATFSRALECFRTDRNVVWWTGQASYRGQAPPARLLKWRRLRNVEISSRRVSLVDMAQGISALAAEDYADALTLWLSRTPLTDLATIARASPAFAWSASSLGIIAAVPGRTLAYRLLLRQPHDLVLAALARAGKEIPARFAQARALSESFASEVAAGIKLLGARPHGPA